MKRGRHPSRPAARGRSDAGRSQRTRLLVLLAVLAAAGIAYLATAGWRERLREESLRSRQVVAAVEQAGRAQAERAAREGALAAALADRPGDVEVRMELARMRWEARGPAEAAATLEAGGEALTDPRALRMLAGAQRLMGREDRALATLDRAIRLAPDEGSLRAERALLLSLIGWLPQAAAELREAEKRRADAAQVAVVRATMARQQGDRRTARRVLEEARRLAPGEPELIRQLAAVEESEGRYAEAARLLESIVESNPDPELWVNLASLYLQSGSPEARARALAAAQRALALRPDLPAARVLAARCLRLDLKPTEARALLDPIHAAHPDRGDVAFELAQIYRDLGMQEQVGPLMARYQTSLRERETMRRAALAVMTHPDRASVHLEIGRLLLKRGMVGRAVLSLERALALDPRLPGARDLLARARAASGSGETAEE